MAGCFVIRASVPHLAGAIGDLARDVVRGGPLRRRARQAGPAFVARHFSIQRSTDLLLGVLQDAQWATPNE